VTGSRRPRGWADDAAAGGPAQATRPPRATRCPVRADSTAAWHMTSERTLAWHSPARTRPVPSASTNSASEPRGRRPARWGWAPRGRHVRPPVRRRELAVQRSVDVAGDQRVDADTVGGVGHRSGASQPDNAVLCRDVGRQAADPGRSGVRGVVDDRAFPGSQQSGELGSQAVERAGPVERQLSAPVGRVDVGRPRRRRRRC
jgi:hypothetical protein